MIMESSSLYLNSKQGRAMPQWITVNQELFFWQEHFAYFGVASKPQR